MRRLGYRPFVFLAFPPSQPLWAQQAAALPGSNSFYSLLQVFFALAVVLGVIGLFAWVLRRMSQGQHFGGGLLKIRGGVMLGPKERVVLLEVADTWIVVGVGAGQVTALHSMPRPAGSDSLPSDAPSPGTFNSWLQRAMHGKAGSGTSKP
ncbi:MAG: flagellar biosynthetic protein FliO [Burkholderiales bacterium]